MVLNEMEKYWVWLSSVEGIGPRRFYQLLSDFEDPRSVWHALGAGVRVLREEKPMANLRAARTSSYIDRLFETLEKAGVQPVTRVSEGYSALLAETYDAPPTLYTKGDPDLRLQRPLAVVGTRSPTRDGRRTAEEFAERLALSGATVVSGLARGVDTCAHCGCLKGGGRTVAVLGCGLDIVYPPENDALLSRILDAGGTVVSEYLPGTSPVPGNFPARNRIISGLSEGVLLVEGGRKSGAMITADYAAEQGRDMFVTPGSIYSSASEAPNALLMQGASPVVSPWDIPEHYRWAERPAVGSRSKREVSLTDEERRIVEPLRAESRTLSEIEAETGLCTAELNSVLTMLELRGIICKVPGGAYRASH